jgi:hemerythrin-like metal-binding protein
VKWSDRYSTGIAHLDEQHKMLFKMSEDYRAALVENRGARVYGTVLDLFSEYARVHFGLEQECMYRYECPAAKANGQAHCQFTESIDAFRQRYMAHGFVEEDARQLVDFVDEWLVHHIGRIDVQLKPCVDRRGS